MDPGRTDGSLQVTVGTGWGEGGALTPLGRCPPVPRGSVSAAVSPQASGTDVGTAETADQRQAENVGHAVRLEGAQSG